jgi:hypothetical protein
MHLSSVDQSLLLAAFFRGNTRDQDGWTSSCDQVITLSLFYTGELSADECRARFENPGYVGGLYIRNFGLRPQIQLRYHALIDLLKRHPELIEGGGDFELPADPTFTACRLTTAGDSLIPEIIGLFPQKPEFPKWPDKRTYSGAE